MTEAKQSYHTAGDRRVKNYWEPIYDTQMDGVQFSDINWDDDHHDDFKRCHFSYDGNASKRLDNKVFRECDFRGEFYKYTVFKNCSFIKCDFGYSSWNGAKFSECTFEDTSFTLSRFQECQFRACKWIRIGLSGNETVLIDVEITNPKKFINAAYVNLFEGPDEESVRKKDAMRLEQTKLTVSRNILRCMSHVGEEEAFYDAVKCNCIQSFKANQSKCWYDGKYMSSMFYAIEGSMLSIAGLINKWGASVLRPFIVGMLLILLFSIIYYLTGVELSFKNSLVAAIDVTLLVGYTKHASLEISSLHQSIMMANMVLGVAWYAVFVPTVINRISRVRA